MANPPPPRPASGSQPAVPNPDPPAHSFCGAEAGERRGTSCPHPGPGAASGRRAPLVYVLRLHIQGTHLGEVPGTCWLLPWPGWAPEYSPPAASMLSVKKRSLASKTLYHRRLLLPPASGFSPRVPFLKVSTRAKTCRTRPLPAFPSAARRVTAR